jgi:hypothetical protein
VPVTAHANSTSPKMAMAISKVFIAYDSDVKVRGRNKRRGDPARKVTPTMPTMVIAPPH